MYISAPIVRHPFFITQHNHTTVGTITITIRTVGMGNHLQNRRSGNDERCRQVQAGTKVFAVMSLCVHDFARSRKLSGRSSWMTPILVVRRRPCMGRRSHWGRRLRAAGAHRVAAAHGGSPGRIGADWVPGVCGVSGSPHAMGSWDRRSPSVSRGRPVGR